MKRIVNILLLGLLYGISIMPMFLLYLLSDFLAFLIYHIIGYRKKIVLQNLSIAFPEKSDAEREAIAKKFYRNFVDTMLESVKLLTSGKKRSDKMFVGDLDVLKDAVKRGKNIQVHAMHNFNWEVINLGISRELNRPFLGVYQPITNKSIDAAFKKMRSRFGTIMIPANDFKNHFLKYQDNQYVLALVADQNPGHPAKAWWLNFFGKPAPFVTGPEKAAKQRDTTVVFGNFYPVKRGIYKIEFEVATDDPKSLPDGELTRIYIKYLERKISERPENYLWSHRRWKHPYKPEYAANTLEKLNLS